MDQERARKIIQATEGMKYSEWRMIAHLIERSYEEASHQVKMTREDAESTLRMWELETGVRITP